MYILSRVCAEFHDRMGNEIHRIRPADLLKFNKVPDRIQEDLLFRMLLEDGSIVLPPQSEAELKRIENDPTAGVDATGKKIKPAETAQEETKPETKPAKVAKASKVETKAETKAEDKAAAAETKAEK